MDWFELSVRMPDDAKCQNLGARLKNPLAFGYVVRLYAHCYLHETDTFSGAAAVAALERAAGWRGKAGKLAETLLEPDVAILERAGDTYTVHAVGRRLAAAVKRREDAAARKRRSRGEEHAGGPPVTRDGTRDASVTSRGSSGYQTRSDQTGPDRLDGQPVSDPSTEGRLAGPSPDLSGICRTLGEAFEHEGPLGVGLEPAKVGASFSRWVLRLGEEATAAECVRIAREQGADPHHLAWFVGWLNTVPTWKLDKLQQRRNGAAKVAS